MRYRVTDKFREMAEFYAKFAVYSNMDFSDEALRQAFEAETYGIKHDLKNNGFAFGKKSMNITIAAWKQDLQDGLITKFELMENYPEESFAREVVQSAIENMEQGTFFPYDNREEIRKIYLCSDDSKDGADSPVHI